MIRRGLLISIARASRAAGPPGERLARYAFGHARTLPRKDRLAPPDSTPLAGLAATVVDCETTGLDPRRDRVVALAALRFHGPAHAPDAVFDTLVDPGMPIAARATAVHGITDAMVAGAPGFRAAARQLAPLLRGAVLVGHAVAFDRAMLASEARRVALPWRDPPALCTRELAAALLPSDAGLELEQLADRFGVAVTGRHTALGDAVAAARIFAALLRRAEAAEAVTLGALRALAEEGHRRLLRRYG